MRVKVAPLLVALAVLFAAQFGLSDRVLRPFWKDHYAARIGDVSALSPDQLLAAFAGFREMIAGILWVRADKFFDEGNYDAILPIIRLVTILDPHQIDVYATGMWHIGYNFTDEESRSDRRYVPSALALGRDGTENNDHTYELFYETGWIWFHKIDDLHQNSLPWLEQAVERDDIPPARRNLLHKAYAKAGEIQKSVEYLASLLEKAEERYEENPNDFSLRSNRDTIENNLDTTLIRMAQRGYFAKEGGYYDQFDYDTKPPFDVGFSGRVTVIEPRVLQVEGSWNVMPVGTRITFVVRDADYPDAGPAMLDWDGQRDVRLDPPRDLTYMQDQLFVRNQRFRRRIDMSRDPTMYPFVADKYLIEFYYNPRIAPAHIQDKFGFDGEGMTDKNYLRDDVRPGQKVIYASFEMTRDQMLRRGEWDVDSGQTPTFTTKGFSERGLNDNTTGAAGILAVPGAERPEDRSFRDAGQEMPMEAGEQAPQ